MHIIFLMRGDLLVSCVLTTFFFLLANAYIELCTPRLSGKPSAESSLFIPDTGQTASKQMGCNSNKEGGWLASGRGSKY